MREKKWFPIGYMFVVTAFFSAIIIGFAEVTRARRKSARRDDRVRCDGVRGCAAPSLTRWSIGWSKPMRNWPSSRRSWQSCRNRTILR